MTHTDRLLAAVGRRLRIAWGFATAQFVVPFIAAAALGLVLLGWVAPWAWPEPAAIVVVVGGLISLCVAPLFISPTTEMAARAADRGVGVKDAFSAVLQFRDNDRFGSEIQARAERFAQTTTASDAVPIPREPRRWIVAGIIGALALALALIANPRDDDRAQAAEASAILEAEAEELDATAESIRSLEDPTEAELAIAEELEQLAEELRQLDELTEAEALLRDASTELAPDASQLFSTKAAVQGLNRSLEAQPLPGTTGDAAEQLEQLAANADGLSNEEAELLADRLDALAATQGAGNAAAADALSQAAEALRAGDAAGAQAGLGEAAAAQRAGEGQVREGQVGQAGAAAAGDSANRVGNAQGEGSGEGSGDGEGSGEGEGSGQGEGSRGDGQGSGGEGQGSGQGGDGSSGSPSGDVGGASGGDNASGQGGAGQPVGGGDSNEVGNELDTPTLFNPGGAIDDLFAGGQSDGDSETVGVGQGQTNAGSTQVPLSDAIGDFERQAVAALSDPSVPPSQRALVQRYFDRLAGLSS